MNFSEIFIRRPVTTTMMTLLLLILGGLTAQKIATDLFPNVESPIVVIKTAYPGAASAEVESQLSKPIEDAVSGINGLKTLKSSSMEGLSSVTAEFNLEIPEKQASQEVRDKLSAITSQLPADAKPPVIQLFNPSDRPVATFALEGDLRVEQFTRLIDDRIRPRLERIAGVAAVTMLGDQGAEVQFYPRANRLDAYHLSASRLFQAIAEANQDLPGGRLDSAQGEFSIRSMGRMESVEALRAFPIVTPLGSKVTLADLGKVELGLQEPRTMAKVDGRPAVMFSIQKQSGANTIAIVEKVNQELERMKDDLPKGVAISTVRDGSSFIKASIDAVWEALIIGGILTVIVLYLFLRNWRATLIGSLAIPLSIIPSFIFMGMANFSFNLLSTLALSLAVGILVDDAVVDLENIYRHMQAGEKPLEAAIKATGEIQLAVTATTLTIVAVFLPVAFMNGTVGRFFKEFGLTVSFAVLVSLLIARTVTPSLAARFLKVEGKHHEETLWGPARGYARLLAWSLRHRALILLIGVATFVGGLALVPSIPKGFMTTADRGEFNLLLELPAGSRLKDTETLADRAVSILKRHPEVHHVFTMVGDRGYVDRATLGVALVPRSQRKLSDRQFARAVHEEVARIPGMHVKVEEIGMLGQGDDNLPVNIVLRGENREQLEQAAAQIAGRLRQAGGYADVDTSFGNLRPELGLTIDHARAVELGVSPQQLARTLRLATTGDVVSTMRLGGDDVDIRLRLDPEDRQDLSRLAGLTVPSSNGSLVRLDALTRIDSHQAPGVSERRDRERTVSVTANLVPGVSVGEATTRAERIVEELRLPKDMTVQFLGQADRMRDTFQNLRGALVLAVIFIYLILATQFESFVHPFTIMLSLPLSVSGAFAGLFLAGKEMGLVSMIGLIMLMGLVTKNGILLVEFTLQKQNEGRSPDEALLTAAPLRLRPILMTSTAMILGMLPIALEFGAATEFRSPMGVVVVGGIITSTLLTLFIVPVVYSLVEEFQRWVRHSSPELESSVPPFHPTPAHQEDHP